MKNSIKDTRPLAERITQAPSEGKISAELMTNYPSDRPRDTIFILPTGADAEDEISRILPNAYGMQSEASRSNAELIAEAFNVTHETRRTPRQLADERAELIASLTECLDIVDRHHAMVYAPNQSSDWKEQATARQLLARLTP